jgi:uncharacterized membrane protein YjgN (DUF898 family)
MTTSTLPMDALPPLAAPERQPQRLQLRFTASGSEYFRIWIVNLLLTLLTVSLYLPWAKVRRLRYFYSNTQVGGQPLDFHGNPRRMLRGHLLTGLLFGLYGLATKVSPTAATIAVLILAAIWPALFRAALQFRLGSTSWRGLRFEFTGSLGGAYQALLPLFVPAILLVVLGTQNQAGRMSAGAGITLLLGLLASLLTLPWCFYRLKRYQHDNYRLGQWQTHFSLTAGRFYVLVLKAGVLAIGLTLLAGALLALAIPALQAALRNGNPAQAMMVAAAAYIGFLFIQLAVVQPYAASRLQNAVWSHTGSADFRFDSHLKARSLGALSLKNGLLMLLTLGLYWPFAAIATRRLRLQAVSLQLSDSPNRLIAGATALRQDATGDAAGDLFGIDIGL